MATSVNFTSLVADVTNYLERGASNVSDPSVYSQIPRLINAAERKVMQALKLLGTIETLVDATGLAIGNAFVDKPDRWRQTVSLSYSGGVAGLGLTLLQPRSYEYCTNYWPNLAATDTAQAPIYYADNDLSSWLIVPTPPETYSIRAKLYMQPELLDASNQTNFWTDYTPNMLLYGTLMEAAPFLKNDERIPTWQNLWNFEAQTLGAQDLQRILDRGEQREHP